MATVTSKGDVALTNSIIDRSITEIEDEMCGSVGKRAFINCSVLEKADFSDVQRIKEEAFRGCSSLNALILRKNSVCAFENNTLADTPIANGDGYIYVPAEKVDATKGNCAYPDKVRAIEDYPEVCSRFGKVWHSTSLTASVDSVTTNGEGMWVAAQKGALYSSTDGKHWHEALASSSMERVVYANGLWIAGGEGNNTVASHYSFDGETWQSISGTKPTGIEQLAYGNGVWVLACYSTTCYSTDGITWTTNAQGLKFRRVYFTGDYFVAATQTGLTTSGVYTSTDGITWTATDFGEGAHDIAYANGNLLIAHSAYYGDYGVWRSTDNGATWSRVLTANYTCDVQYANGLWVACAQNAMCYSTDAVTWTKVSVASATFEQCCYSNGLWFAISTAGLYVSHDGKKWELSDTIKKTTDLGCAFASDDGICVVATTTGLKYTTH